VVEGFGPEDIALTRYSLSTKAADCLASGAAVFAYGPKDAGVIGYLIRTEAAVCCTEKEKLEGCLKTLLHNAVLQEKCYKQAVNVSKINHTLYASWKANTYNVTFDPNGGTVSTTSKSYTYGSGIYDLPNPTREGYIFDGWFTEESGGNEVKAGDIYNYAKDITLYAHWTEKPTQVVTFTANYYDERGRMLGEKKLTQGEPYGTLLDVPHKAGYRAVGWYSSAKKAIVTDTDIVGLYDNDSLHVRYEPIEYTATFNFDSNGSAR
ncbi:MAG: InlB B-repeat-containing protein, partial [Pseudobutyrivibrio sp.]|nr:InlB B-repeat-containing protein [Pseudobutyrivibrio sp.]